MPVGLILLQVAPASCSRECHGLVMYSVEKALYFWPYRLIHLLSEYPLSNNLPRATLAQNRLEKTAESLCSRILPCFRGDSFALGQHVPLRSQSAHAERAAAIWEGNSVHLRPGFEDGIAAISEQT